MKPYLSVIITNYNEEANLYQGRLDELLTGLNQSNFTWELILVNDGSTDNTLELLKGYSAKDNRVRILDIPHQGKAGGIISGAMDARGQFILFTDMDQSTPIGEFGKFIQKFSDGFSVVIGSRSKREGAPLFRQVLAYGMVFLRTLVLQLPVRDSQCGFKAFTGEASGKIFPILKKIHPFREITQATTNPGFDLEILYLARKLKLKMAEVPVTWHYRESKRVSFVKDAVNGLKELFLVRWRSLTNQYRLN